LNASTDGTKEELLRYVREHRGEIEEEVYELYLSSAFTNRYVLHPRKLKEIAKDDIDQFIGFLDSLDEQKAVNCGNQRARAGLSHKAFVNMGTILRIHALRSADQQNCSALETAITLVDTYVHACIAGYIEQLEIQLLDDQEKMRIALARAERGIP
jgi:hypothetical protein